MRTLKGGDGRRGSRYCGCIAFVVRTVVLLYPSLHLTAFSAPQPVVLVHAVDALKLCGNGGGRALSRGETVALVGALGPRQWWTVRAFVARLGVRGVDLTRMRDGELGGWLVRQVSAGQLVAVRTNDAPSDAGGDKALIELRKLVRQIETQLQGKLVADGRRHKLVAGEDLTKLADRDSYHIVSQAEARAVLDRVAGSAGGSGVLPGLLATARGKLSRDWRPPFEPDGLVLLRRIPVVAAHKPALAEVMSPSALKKLRDEGWVEIALVDAGGEPIVDADYEVKLPDGQTKRSTTDPKGAARFEGIMPGECLVSFPKAKGPVGLA